MRRLRQIGPALALAALLVPGASFAQDQPQEAERPEPNPLGTRLIDTPTPFTIGSRRVELLFSHRFQQTVQDGDSHNLWGMDGGADVGIGLGLGVTRHLDLAVLRSSFQENFELSAKYLVAEQSPRVPLSLGLRVGADLLRREGIEDADRPFIQLLLARELVPGVSLVLSPAWVRDTPRLRDAFNVPVGITFPIHDSLIEIEWIPANRDLDESEDAWHVAISKQIGGHIFEVLAGNSRGTTVDQYLGGDSAAGFKAGDVRLGFNLIRDFD